MPVSAYNLVMKEKLYSVQATFINPKKDETRELLSHYEAMQIVKDWREDEELLMFCLWAGMPHASHPILQGTKLRKK